MSSHTHRAQLLLDQGRYVDAEKELGQALVENPEDPWAHALLGLCLSNQDKHLKASEVSKRAVGLAPDSAEILHLSARVELERNALAEAERLFTEAIAIDPQNPHSFSGRAAVHASRKNWQQVLDDCQQALAIDPELIEAINLSSLANRGLGKTEEFFGDINHALKNNPNNGWSHANLGWSYLEKGNLQKAEEHFREALRINPELEWARVGVLETTKAKFPIYRWLLNYFLWMGKQTGQRQMLIIGGFWIGSQIVRSVANTNPEIAPFLGVLLGIYALFCLATWIARPLSNAILMTHPFGRLALDFQEKREAVIVIGILLIGIIFLLTEPILGSRIGGAFGISLLLTGVPIAMAFQLDHPKAKNIMWIAACCIGCMATVDFLVVSAVVTWGSEQTAEALPIAFLAAYKHIQSILSLSPLLVLVGSSYLSSQHWSYD